MMQIDQLIGLEVIDDGLRRGTVKFTRGSEGADCSGLNERRAVRQAVKSLGQTSVDQDSMPERHEVEEAIACTVGTTTSKWPTITR